MEILKKQPFMTLNLINFDSGRVFQLRRSQISHTKTALVSKAFFSVRHLCILISPLHGYANNYTLQYKITFLSLTSEGHHHNGLQLYFPKSQ